MIRRLRDRHRRIMPVLALLVAIALLIALRARHHDAGQIPSVLQPQAEAR